MTALFGHGLIGGRGLIDQSGGMINALYDHGLFGEMVSAFDPLTLSPTVWYDPSDAATVFTDTAGTTQAAVGDAVARINDKSGNNYHATQPTLAKRPILQQTGGGLRYLQFDGVDDAFSAIGPLTLGTADKAQIFAGLTKLSNAVRIFLELSANYNVNHGSFYVAPGPSWGFDSYTALARGTAGINGNQAGRISGLLQPHTAVLTTTHDIAGDLSTLRINGANGTSGAAEKGLGNFGSYPLFLGGRGGTSFYFVGHMYSLIVRFGANNLSPEQIGFMEAHVAAKTGVTL